MKPLESILAAFKQGNIQDALTMMDLISAHGYSLDDLRDHVENLRASMIAKAKTESSMLRAFIDKAPRCGECGQPMNLFPVNSGPRDQVGGDWKSQWVCMCGEAVYNTESPAEVLEALGITQTAEKPNDDL